MRLFHDGRACRLERIYVAGRSLMACNFCSHGFNGGFVAAWGASLGMGSGTSNGIRLLQARLHASRACAALLPAISLFLFSRHNFLGIPGSTVAGLGGGLQCDEPNKNIEGYCMTAARIDVRNDTSRGRLEPTGCTTNQWRRKDAHMTMFLRCVSGPRSPHLSPAPGRSP